MTELRGLPGLDALTRAIEPVATRFSDAGHRLYLVGGGVRELLLAGSGPFDVTANDIDLTTDAVPRDIKRLVSPLAEAVWSQGERFGTIGAKVGGHDLEITTHRAEAYDPQSRKPIVTFGEQLDEDLSRRDFTINAAAIELSVGDLHDPYDGAGDLEAGLLRTPLSPAISFGDDPLRMMRAARFIARFGLKPSGELERAAVELADRLRIVSVERIADELNRLLLVADPTAGLDFLERTGLLDQIVPELADPTIRANAISLAGADGPGPVRLAGLLWPVRGEGADILRRLKYSRADMNATTRLLSGVDRAVTGSIDEAAVRRVTTGVGFENLEAVRGLASNLAAVADDGGGIGVLADDCRRLVALIGELSAAEDLSNLESPLSGQQIMDAIGVAPGPDIGRAQKFLRDLRIDGGPLGEDAAVQALKRWWNDRQL